MLSFARREGAEHLVIILHFGEGSCRQYRLGVPSHSRYRVVLNSDDARFGGTSGVSEAGDELATELIPFLGWHQSLLVALPPRTALVLAPVSDGGLCEVQPPPPGSVPVPWGGGPAPVFGKG